MSDHHDHPPQRAPNTVRPRGPRPPLRPELTVRQVAADYPGCREVFLRYGEPADRPGKFGHLEPLPRFAARVHVSLDQLLEELARAAGVGIDREAALAERVHHPFLFAALVLTLTLGAGWGAWLLFAIGWRGDFTAASTAHVVAHGEAQLWGFVGLFIFGIALRYLPVATAAPRPRLWHSGFLLAAALSGTVGGFAWSMAPTRWTWLGPGSGAALVLAALAFLAFVWRQTMGKLTATWARFVLMAAVWLVAWSSLTLLLRCLAAAQGPGVFSHAMRMIVIQLAVFGFVSNTIFGFGQKLLAGFLGSGSLRRWPIEAAFWTHNLATGTLLAGTYLHLPAGVCAGSLGMLAAAVLYAVGLHGFRQGRRMTLRPEQGEAAVISRLIQLAFFWLVAGLVLLVVGEMYPIVRSGAAPLPHAYFGAVRHALTVGFITTLILGVGQRLVPILEQTRLPWPRLVLPILLLIGLGNAGRVTTELALLAFPGAFAIMPWSSVLELAALTLFSVNIAGTLWPPRDSLLRTGQVTALSSVALLMAERHWLEDELQSLGFEYLGRVRAVPKELTLGSLAASAGRNVADVVEQINVRLRQAR